MSLGIERVFFNADKIPILELFFGDFPLQPILQYIQLFVDVFLLCLRDYVLQVIERLQIHIRNINEGHFAEPDAQRYSQSPNGLVLWFSLQLDFIACKYFFNQLLKILSFSQPLLFCFYLLVHFEDF